jgi:hypothetical protein
MPAKSRKASGPPSDPPEQDTAEDHSVDHVRMQKILEQEAKVRELEVSYKTCQEETKDARQELSAAIAFLRRLIRGEVEYQAELDFGDDGEPTQQSWDELLESTQIQDVVSLTKQQRKKLEDHGVRTLKQFEQLRAGDLPGYSGYLSDMFNESIADKLEDGVLDWNDRQRIQRSRARASVTKKDLVDEVADKFEKVGLLTR